MKWIFFSLWSSNSNVTIYYYQYATGKISIFVRLTSEQFINLISPCNQKQRYLLQPLHWLHEWWRTLEQWFVSGNIQGWWCCMRKCWRFRNKSLGREAPYDWLLSNLCVIVVAECLILKHYLIKETAERASMIIQNFLLALWVTWLCFIWYTWSGIENYLMGAIPGRSMIKLTPLCKMPHYKYQQTYKENWWISRGWERGVGGCLS